MTPITFLGLLMIQITFLGLLMIPITFLGLLMIASVKCFQGCVPECLRGAARNEHVKELAT